MKEKITAAITGVGAYVPDYILDNEEISRMVDTSDEWIMSRIGIKTRHILKGEGLGTSFMGVKAVNELLEKTGTDAKEVDLVICATVTPDMLFPSTANIIAYKVGAVNAFAFDMQAACSGFIFALQTGSKYVAAVMLEPNYEGLGIQNAILHSDGSGAPHLHMKAGGSAYPPTVETVLKKWHKVYQEGQAVFKAAVTHMADTSVELMERNNLTPDNIRYLVPHQANMRIIDATAKRMGLPQEKCMINIDRYGNTTDGTLGLCLWDYESRLRKGDNLVLATFGGGFTWGAMFVKWAYDGDTMAR